MGNITEPYAKHALQFPTKIALQTQEEKITYHEWANLINKTARWLDSFSDEHKTLGIYLPNGVPFLQFFSGAAAAGWIAVLFDQRWNPIEIERRFAISRPSLFITSRILREKVKHLCTNIIMIEDCIEEILSFNEIQQKKINGNLPFYMGFTSGTTGEPKAFIRAHESWIASFQCNSFDLQMNEQERVLIPGSLIHSHFLYGAISTLYLGGTVSLLKKFTSKQALSIIQAQSITTMFVVPTMIHALLKEDITISQPIKLISSGAKWEDRSKELIHKKFLQLTSFEFYGASELSFVTVLSQYENLIKPGSVGKPCYGVELQIRRNNLELANPFEIGKIFIRSNMLFLGYLQHQLPTIHSIVDSNGWVTVDDMGYLDQDGYLFIVGREKNMILYGGINLFPEEIEKVISAHEQVEEVAVIGIQDEYWGQIACAVIIGNVTKRELIRYCKGALSSYKIPRKWVFVDKMPYTISGKIARAQLKEQLEREVMSH